MQFACTIWIQWHVFIPSLLTNHIWINATTQHRTDNKCNRLDEIYNLVAQGTELCRSRSLFFWVTIRINQHRYCSNDEWTVERACKRDRPCPNGNEDSMAFLYTHISTHTRDDVDTSTQVKQQLWMGLMGLWTGWCNCWEEKMSGCGGCSWIYWGQSCAKRACIAS